MVRKCKHACYYPENANIFSEKTLTYKEGNYCSVCVIWMYKPTLRCICCGSVARTGERSPKKGKTEEEKSFEELGLDKTLRRATPDLILEINDLLNSFENRPYEVKLLTLKQYDGGGDYLYDTPLDEFKDLLAKLNNDKQKQHYRRIFVRQLDDFAREYKLGLDGMTEEEQKIESKKRLDEGIRRDAAAEARGNKMEYVPFIDIPIEDKEEDETKTNNVKGH